nr:IucA/IucC family protein [uncultured Shinella sp.]
MVSLQQAAEAATFQSFANCYLREINPGVSVTHRDGARSIDCIEWTLAGQRLVLRAEIASRSLCGPLHFGRIWTRPAIDLQWRGVEPMSALPLLVQDACRLFEGSERESARAYELGLMLRVMQSYQSTAENLAAARPIAADGFTFLDAERNIAYGHWLHPTPKSREGMSFWQQETYAPEFGGDFPLHYFAARRDFVREDSAIGRSAAEIVRSLAPDLPLATGETLLPMHPLQAQALLLDPAIQALIDDGALRSLGPHGLRFAATSSVRTVYNAAMPFMLKFSLPVRITNSLRVNRLHELDAGVAIARLIDKAGIAGRYAGFHIVRDPAHISLALPDRVESGFEVIIRENPFPAGRDHGIVTLAALTADPLPGAVSLLEAILCRLSTGGDRELARVAAIWFERYLDHALDPLLTLYDDFGIALEAHQQNSLLDVSSGFPSAYYYRDNQGFYLAERHRASLARLVPEMVDVDGLYFPEADIHDRFAYYAIVNQIFSVISRMGHDGLVEETVLLAILHRRLENLAQVLTGAGRRFAESLLHSRTIAAKANLRARLFGVDELQAEDTRSLYRRIENPLWNAGAVGRLGHAIAS